VYVTGGLTEMIEVDKGQKVQSPEKSCERYDICTDKWQQISPLLAGSAKASPSLMAV
jgi:hypothetical protein